MPKKFIIKDDDGKQFEVTEETVDEEPEAKSEEMPEVHDDEGLTADEIAALKNLAAKAEDILKLLEVEAKEHAATSDEGEDVITDEDVKAEDADMTEDEDEEETIVKTADSKKSIGSIEKKKNVMTNDSIEDSETAIAQAWADRFKKSYKKGE